MPSLTSSLLSRLLLGFLLCAPPLPILLLLLLLHRIIIWLAMRLMPLTLLYLVLVVIKVMPKHSYALKSAPSVFKSKKQWAAAGTPVKGNRGNFIKGLTLDPHSTTPVRLPPVVVANSQTGSRKKKIDPAAGWFRDGEEEWREISEADWHRHWDDDFSTWGQYRDWYTTHDQDYVYSWVHQPGRNQASWTDYLPWKMPWKFAQAYEGQAPAHGPSIPETWRVYRRPIAPGAVAPASAPAAPAGRPRYANPPAPARAPQVVADQRPDPSGAAAGRYAPPGYSGSRELPRPYAPPPWTSPYDAGNLASAFNRIAPRYPWVGHAIRAAPLASRLLGKGQRQPRRMTRTEFYKLPLDIRRCIIREYSLIDFLRMSPEAQRNIISVCYAGQLTPF